MRKTLPAGAYGDQQGRADGYGLYASAEVLYAARGVPVDGAARWSYEAWLARARKGRHMDDQQPSGHEGGGEHEYEPGSGTLHVFGQQLKLCRLRAGMERSRLGALTGYSASTIASFEQGRRIPPPKFIDKVDDVLDAGGVLKAGKEEVARAQYPAFFRDAARLEAEAVDLHVYANHVVPGLLQTEEYARAVFTMRRPLLREEVIEQRVAARLIRQEIFSRDSTPLMSFIVEEPVLHRPWAGRTSSGGNWSTSC